MPSYVIANILVKDPEGADRQNKLRRRARREKRAS
jgi:hypothetical protein